MLRLKYNIIINSSLNKEEIKDRLLSVTELHPDFIDYFKDKFWGEIQNDHFVLYKSVFSKQPYLKIKGNYLPNFENGSIIKIQIGIPEYLTAISIITLIVVVLLSYVTIKFAEPFWLKLTPLYFLLAAYFVILGPYYFLSKYNERKIISLLKGN
jgi:hypothetical protein